MLESVVKFAVHLSLVAACPSMRGTVVAMAGSTDAVVVSSIRPGSPASRHVGLVPGLLLERVQVRACCLDPRLVSQAYLSFF